MPCAGKGCRRLTGYALTCLNAKLVIIVAGQGSRRLTDPGTDPGLFSRCWRHQSGNGGIAIQDLTGKTALVTGATSGIGTALALAKAGAVVAVSGRDKEKGEAVVEAIGAAGGSAVFLAADLVDSAAALDLAARATEALGGRGRHPGQQRRRVPVRPHGVDR